MKISKYYILLIYPILILISSLLHTINVYLLDDSKSVIGIFLSGFFGVNCSISSEYYTMIKYSNMTLVIILIISIINFIYYLLGKRYSICFIKINYFFTFYNSLFIIILWLSYHNKIFGRLVLYFPYLKELSRLSFASNLSQYTILIILTLLQLVFVIFDFLKVKYINLKYIFYLFFSYILYILLFEILISRFIRYFI